MSGVIRVAAAFASMAALLMLWAVVLPGAVMLVVLYACRFIPLAGRHRRSKP